MEIKSGNLRKTTPPECLEYTYTGLFETRKNWSSGRMTYPDGTWKYAGFGHLGDAPEQLLMKSEDDVNVMPNCKTNKSEVNK